uniref:Uncharacterized protein AlNc14C153G7586 n=1 Tax=Albugo laibachii Nc14 TaxID=890382 RepID=F0WM82_9STRA|nr:conserved hypothetical protein [Albugo laibachii Nc14]|eukprot:CCA22411.1 conserved hypothetical protein [Albugo laibachii Nc14]
MGLFYAEGSDSSTITDERLGDIIKSTLTQHAANIGHKLERVVLVPPEFTRYHSKAGLISQFIYDQLQEAIVDVLPALGIHAPMTDSEISKHLFRVHDWRNDVVTSGMVPSELVAAPSDGKVNDPWPAQVNKLLWEGKHDLIVSIGQVVPHEVMGMANNNKNIFVGTRGSDAINFSHFIGAVYGMEQMMGRANNPLCQVLNYASEHFLKDFPLLYIQKVVLRADDGQLVTRGVFIGDDDECFLRASALSLEVNFKVLEHLLEKVVVYLHPEYKSTWLGNKSIYRTRMAIADGGELIILAPGVKHFGEDTRIDELIRKYGYRTTPEILLYLDQSRHLIENLSAAAHLIHGSSEGRFRIRYCPGVLTRKELKSVGFEYGDLTDMLQMYSIDGLNEGFNTTRDGSENLYYISNPSLGLWACRSRFDMSNQSDEILESSDGKSNYFNIHRIHNVSMLVSAEDHLPFRKCKKRGMKM